MPFLFSTTRVQCTSQNSDIEAVQPIEEADELSMEMNPSKVNSHRPPSFESLFHNVSSITKKMEVIKGFRFELSGALSNRFQMIHSWNIPHKTLVPRGKPPKIANYTLTTQYLHGNIKTYFDVPKFIMTGRFESSGKLDTAIIKKMTDSLTVRLSTSYPTEAMIPPQLHLDFDHEGNDSTSNFKLGSGFLSFNTMQAIGKRLSLGFEIFNLYLQEKRTEFSYAARFKHNNHLFLAQYMGMMGKLNIAYGTFVPLLNQLKPRAFLVSEIEVNPKTGESNTTIGVRQKFSSSEIVATLSSAGKLSTALTMKGFAYSLKLCATGNYMKDSFKFGYGITMGNAQ